MAGTEEEYYRRQVTLIEFGITKQAILRKATVIVVGAGGLGCPALQYLAGAGIGNLIIIDGDSVQINNLHRQVLYNIDDIGKNKSIIASDKLKKLNPFIKIFAIPHFIDEKNALSYISRADVVIDATDNFETRQLLGNITKQLNKPLVFSAIYAFEGQLSVFNYKQGPAFSDAFPNNINPNSLNNCAENGVVGFVPGILGILQALETIKILIEDNNVCSGKLILINTLTLEKHEFKINRKSSSDSHFVTSKKLNDFGLISEITAYDLFQRLENSEKEIFLLDVREKAEWDEFNIGGNLIPLGELSNRINEIPLDKDIVIFCKSGYRSYNAALFLIENHKFKKVFNLKGGLISWLNEFEGA